MTKQSADLLNRATERNGGGGSSLPSGRATCKAKRILRLH